MSKKVKIFAIVAGVIIVLILAFTYIGGNSTPAPLPVNGISSSATDIVPTGDPGVTAAPNGNNFSVLLSSISSITLDTSIFSSAGYKALRDNPVSLGTATIGRQNPFAPIGTDSGSGQQASNISVQTLVPSKVLGTSAEFGALVTAQSTAPTTVVFQYGTSNALGSATAPTNVTKNGTALYTISGLTPNTAYYVQATAVQGSTTATGTVMSFTTAKQ